MKLSSMLLLCSGISVRDEVLMGGMRDEGWGMDLGLSFLLSLHMLRCASKWTDGA